MDAFIGEIRAFPYFYVPEGWLSCDGSKLQINLNQALYSILGLYYGGNQQQGYFNVPNLQGQVAVGVNSSDSDFYAPGKTGGNNLATLSVNQIPPHLHDVNAITHAASQVSFITNQPSNAVCLTNTTTKPASGTPLVVRTYSNGPLQQQNQTYLAPASIGLMGGNTAHENRQPYLTFWYCICNSGDYPIRP
jgi:microcystin-dependent protein